VQDEQLTRNERVLRVRFAADPASVPGARRFVEEGLRAWGHDSLVDDATLCVSELAGNAALHGSGTYIEVCVLELDRAVRLWVEDDDPAPAAVIAPRTMLPGLDEAFDDELDELDLLLNAPATGRGLAIVSVLASDWGVEELETGKRVWAVLSPDGSAEGRTDDGAGRGGQTLHAAAAREAHDGPDATTPATADGSLPDGWVVVRLAGCPVELSLRQDQHLDELVRELTLMSVDTYNAQSASLARRLEAILRAPAQARAAGRRQAQEALSRGDRFVDVEMAMPREFAHEVLLLHAAVTEADVLCEKRRLLTLTSPQELRDFRSWMTEEIVGQIDHGIAPMTWADWLAHH
jgi:anti-sigma regulatory factor (Ser/Thr protein kinase)